MQSWSSLTTGFATLANSGLARVFDNHSILADSGTNAGSFSPLVVGIALLLILAIIGAGIVYVRRKQSASWEEPVNQGSAAFSGAHLPYGQNYGNTLGSAQQESWPWAKKAELPAGYNPTTPNPEMLRTPSLPDTPVPAMPAIPVYNAVPTIPVQEMPDIRRSDHERDQSALYRSSAGLNPLEEQTSGVRSSSDQLIGVRLSTDQAPVTPLPQVPVTPSTPTQNAVQQASMPVLDAELEAIMRQVQVGLFALPKQHRRQEDL